MSVRLSILKAALRERLTYDLGPLRAPAAWALYGSGAVLRSFGKPSLGFQVLMRTHDAGFSSSVDRRIVREIREATAQERKGVSTGLFRLYDDLIRDATHKFRTGPNSDPLRLVGSRILVVKTARPRERGVIVVDYSYVMPLLPGLFDLPAITDKYFIVLEPSWSGGCSPEVLLYSRLNPPVFVQTIEPRERDLLTEFGQPFQPVYPSAANYWIDHRLMTPRPAAQRDIDVIMVAAWADVKRHWRFFRALAELRRRGHRLSVALVGYQYDKTQQEIAALAAHYGVHDQIQYFERIDQRQVSELLCRSRIHVLWSRRESSNRAIIEAMLADVPVIVRAGLSYGFPYAHINPQTGKFVAESDLADAMLEMIERRHEYAPRQWVLDHMSSQQSTARLEEHVRKEAMAAGEDWSEGLVAKTSTLDTQRYWNPDDRERFRRDYEFLVSTIRP